MSYILIGVACWLVAVLTILGLFHLGRGDLDDEEDYEEGEEPDWSRLRDRDDQPEEKPDRWGRDPDWNWPRGWGRPRD